MPRNSDPYLTNRVRDLRGQTERMTQQSLADAVFVTRQTIVAMETGTYTPSLGLAIRIARVFECTMEDVFELNE